MKVMWKLNRLLRVKSRRLKKTINDDWRNHNREPCDDKSAIEEEISQPYMLSLSQCSTLFGIFRNVSFPEVPAAFFSAPADYCRPLSP
jgi:hypothetical protein